MPAKPHEYTVYTVGELKANYPELHLSQQYPECLFRFRHQDGSWSNWVPVVPLKEAGRALQDFGPDVKVLSVKDKDGRVRQWKPMP